MKRSSGSGFLEKSRSSQHCSETHLQRTHKTLDERVAPAHPHRNVRCTLLLTYVQLIHVIHRKMLVRYSARAQRDRWSCSPLEDSAVWEATLLRNAENIATFTT